MKYVNSYHTVFLLFKDCKGNFKQNIRYIIIEMKYTKNDESNLKKLAKMGLQQIINKKYFAGLNNDVIYLSLSHRGQDIENAYQIKENNL